MRLTIESSIHIQCVRMTALFQLLGIVGGTVPLHAPKTVMIRKLTKSTHDIVVLNTEFILINFFYTNQ